MSHPLVQNQQSLYHTHRDRKRKLNQTKEHEKTFRLFSICFLTSRVFFHSQTLSSYRERANARLKVQMTRISGSPQMPGLEEMLHQDPVCPSVERKREREKRRRCKNNALRLAKLILRRRVECFCCVFSFSQRLVFVFETQHPIRTLWLEKLIIHNVLLGRAASGWIINQDIESLYTQQRKLSGHGTRQLGGR